jgi:hypothetical protein
MRLWPFQVKFERNGERPGMLFGPERKGWRFFVNGIAVSAALLFATYGRASAEDHDMTVLAHASSGPLSCEIRRSGAEGAVQLTGVVSSSVALSGRFQFSIMKSGASGSSNINQGNQFAVEAGKEIYVGHVKINLGHDDRAMIELSASSNDGVDCRANASIGR